jgi:hypothetical protein
VCFWLCRNARHICSRTLGCVYPLCREWIIGIFRQVISKQGHFASKKNTHSLLCRVGILGTRGICVTDKIARNPAGEDFETKNPSKVRNESEARILEYITVL